MPHRAARGRFHGTVIKRLERDPPLDKLVLQDVDDALQFEVVVGMDCDLFFLLVEINRTFLAFEIVPLYDLFAGLVDRVVNLLEVYFGDYVEGECVGHKV